MKEYKGFKIHVHKWSGGGWNYTIVRNDNVETPILHFPYKTEEIAEMAAKQAIDSGFFNHMNAIAT